MKICYVDEAGCTGALTSATCPIQPTLTILGVIVDYSQLYSVTEKFLNLKQRFFPGLAPIGTSHLGWMLREIKGSDLRRDAVEGGRNLRRQRIGFITEAIKLCEMSGARLVGRIWIKGISAPINPTSIYTYSIQSIYTDFQNYLTKHDDIGVVITDSRLKHLNTPVAHSIFTQKFKGSGDSYDRIVELPAFSHSDNHAGLQIADILCSAILTPMAIHTYCEGTIQSIHVRPGYSAIKAAFSDRCRKMQHRYREASGRMRGGFVVSDSLNQQSGVLLFRQPPRPILPPT